MDLNTKDIALRIKQLCKDKKMSVKSVLKECSLNKSFIYDLEKRGSVPSIEKFYNLANYLDCSVDYLLGRVDNINCNNKTVVKAQNSEKIFLNVGSVFNQNEPVRKYAERLFEAYNDIYNSHQLLCALLDRKAQSNDNYAINVFKYITLILRETYLILNPGEIKVHKNQEAIIEEYKKASDALKKYTPVKLAYEKLDTTIDKKDIAFTTKARNLIGHYDHVMSTECNDIINSVGNCELIEQNDFVVYENDFFGNIVLVKLYNEVYKTAYKPDVVLKKAIEAYANILEGLGCCLKVIVNTFFENYSVKMEEVSADGVKRIFLEADGDEFKFSVDPATEDKGENTDNYVTLSESQRAILKYLLYHKLIDCYEDDEFFSNISFKKSIGTELADGIMTWFRNPNNYSVENSNKVSSLLNMAKINGNALNDYNVVNYLIDGNYVFVSGTTLKKLGVNLIENTKDKQIVSLRVFFENLKGINITTLEMLDKELFEQVTFNSIIPGSDLQKELLNGLNRRANIK